MLSKSKTAEPSGLQPLERAGAGERREKAGSNAPILVLFIVDGARKAIQANHFSDIKNMQLQVAIHNHVKASTASCNDYDEQGVAELNLAL